MEKIVFYILAAMVFVFSILTVTSRKILRAAVYLLFVLLATAGLFFMLNFNFLAAVQLTVYAGGIVVLIIFSVMLTSHVDEKLEAVGRKKLFFSFIAVSAGALVTISTILEFRFKPVSNTEMDSSMRRIGMDLLSYNENGFVLPFEVISILLLAAMVGAILLARREHIPDEQSEIKNKQELK